MMDRILIVSGGAPPDITGSGLRAFRLAEKAHESRKYDIYFCTYSEIESDKIKHLKNHYTRVKWINLILFPFNLVKNYQTLKKMNSVQFIFLDLD